MLKLFIFRKYFKQIIKEITVIVVEIGLDRVVTLAREPELAVFLLVIQQTLQFGEHFATVTTYQYVWIAWKMSMD